MTPVRFPFSRFLVPVLASVVASCGDVLPRNPYDPQTPLVEQATATIAGTVVLQDDGASVAGAKVRLVDGQGAPVRGGDGQVLEAAVEGSAASGPFTLGGITPGRYRVQFDVDARFSQPFVPELELGPGDVRSLGTLVFTVQQTGTGRVRGRAALIEAAGGPRSITLYRKRDGRPPELVRRVTTDANGVFEADQLPPGTYAVSAEATGFFPDFSAGHVLAGEQPNGLVNEVVLEGDDELRLYPATAVLVPDLPRKGTEYFTNADALDLLVIPTVVDAWVTDMRLSADRAFRSGEGELPFDAFRQRANVTLPALEGVLPIYGQFQAKAGEFDFTTDVFDTQVVRDVTPPQFVAKGLRGFNTGRDGIAWLREDGATVTIELQANDVSSAVSAYGVYMDPANDPGTAEAVTFRDVSLPPGFVRLDHTTQLLPGQGPRVIGLWLKDNAGNIAGPERLEVVVDSEPPAIVEPLTVVNANQQKELDSRFAVLRVPVDPACLEEPVTAAAGTCPVEFRYGTSPMPSVGLFSPFQLGEGGTVVVPVSGGNGQSVGFAVELRDAAGNVASYVSELYTLKLLGAMTGRALVEGFPDGAPAHGGVVVSLYEPGTDPRVLVARGTSEDDGRFVIKTANDDPNLASTRLPAGRYLVVAERADLEPFEAEAEVRENETTTLPAYRLTPARGNVRGRFVRSDLAASGTAHGGIEVNASRGGIVIARTVTADDGTYSFPAPGLPVTSGGSRYVLQGAANGYAARRIEGVEVARAEETVIESDGAEPPSPNPVELTRLAGDFVFCESLSGECLPTVYANRGQVRIRLLEATGVERIRFSARTNFAPDAETPAWRTFDATTAYVVDVAGATDPDGPVTVYVQTQVSGTPGPVMNATVLVDRVAPTVTSLELFPGTDALDGFTNRPNVRGVVQASAGTGDVAPLQSAYAAFAATPPTAIPASAVACGVGANCTIPLSPGGGTIAEGKHTAYAFACDRAGNCSTAPASDSIVYDITPPRQSNGVTFEPAASWITRVEGTWYSRSGKIDVGLATGTAKTATGAEVRTVDGALVPDVAAYRFGLRMDVTDASFRTLSAGTLPGATITATGPDITGEDGRYDVYAQFRDAAGNVTEVEANPRTFAIVVDRLPPAVALTVNGGAEWSKEPEVTLEVTTAAGDTGPAREVLLSLDGGLFQAFTRRTLPLVGANARYTLPSVDGPYVLYGRFIDAAGNVSDRPSRIYLDRTAPRIVALRCGTCREDPTTGTLYMNAVGRQAVLDLVVSDNSGAVASVSTQVGANPAASTGYIGTATVTLPDADGPHVVRVRASDPAGNVSEERALTIVLDRTPPAVGMKLDDDRPYARSASVIVGITNDDGSPLSGVRVSNTATFSGAVQSFAARIPWALATPDEDGTRTVYVEVTDPAGNTTTLSDTIILDTHAPRAPTLSITTPTPVGSSNAITTAAVTLAIDGNDGSRPFGTSAVLVEGDIAATGGSSGWLTAGTGGLAFASDRFTWTGNLSSGDGSKALGVRVRDAAGNVSETTTLRALLRTAAPSGNSVTLAPAPFARTTAATLTLASVGATQMKVSGDLASVLSVPANVDAWIPFVGTVPVVLSAGDGLKTITVRFRNEAEQASDPLTATTTLDTTVPVATLAIRGTVAEGQGSATLTAQPVVTLAVTATDATAGVDVMRVATTEDGLADATWAAFAATSSWTLAGADGSKSLFLQLRDRAGNVSTAATASITLDTAAPSAPVITVTAPATLGTGNALAGTAITLGVASTDVAGSLASGRVRFDGDITVSGTATTGWLAAGSGGLTLDGSNFSWIGALASGDGPKAVTVTVRDAAGNTSAASTVRFVLQSAPPASPVATLAASPNTATAAVTVSLSAVGASQFRIAGDAAAVNGAPGNVDAWLPMASSAAVTLSAGDGSKALVVTYRNAANVETTGITVTTRLDTTAPSGTLVVTGTALGSPATSVTSTPAVTVALDASDAGSGLTEMRLANAVDALATAGWRPYAPNLPWTLSAGDGSKLVVAQFKDAAGNVSPLATPPQATIVLDTAAPTQPVVAITTPTPVGTANAITTASVTLEVTSTDGARTLDSASVLLEGDLAVTGGSTGWLNAGAGGLTFASGKFTWSGSLSPADGNKSVTVRVRDTAGNLSGGTIVRALLRTAAPTGNSVTISPANFAPTTAATLTATSVGATSMKVSGDLASVLGVPANVGAWIPYTASVPVVLSTGEGAKSIAVVFRNEAAQESAAINVSTVLDTVPPAATLEIRGPVAGGAESTTLTGRPTVTLALTSTDATSGVDQMRLATTASDLANQSWSAFSAAVPWTLAGADGSKSVFVQLRDRAGHVSTAVSGTTLLDTQPPAAPTLTVTSPSTLGTGNALASTAVVIGIVSTDAAGSLATGRVRVDGDVDVAGVATTGWAADGQAGLSLVGADFRWSGSLSGGDGAKAVTVLVQDPAGNESPASTLRFNLQSTAPASPVATLSSTPNTSSTALTVALSAVGATEVRLAGDLASVNGAPANVGAWIPMASTANVVLTTGDGAKSVAVTFRNAALVATTPLTLSTRLDTTAPAGSFTISGTALGAPSNTLTSTSAVTLAITGTESGSGLTEMRLANTTGALSSAEWRPFAPSLPWSLSTGDGTKTVYLQLRDAAGNTSSGTTPLSASIELDTGAPTQPVVAITSPVPVGSANAVTTTALTVEVTATDGARAISTAAVQFSGDLSVTGGSTGWLSAGSGGLTFASGKFTWTGSLTTGDGPKSFTVRVRDAAGNEGAPTIANALLRTAAPTGNSATISPATFTTTTASTLTLSSVGATEVRVVGDVSSVLGVPANVNAWIPYSGSVPVALTTGDGLKTLTITFRNEANQASSPVTVTTTLDGTAPTASLAIRGVVADGATSTTLTGRTSVTLAVTGTDATAGVDQMRVATTEPDLANQPWSAFASAVPWTLSGADGSRSLFLQLRDKAGNVSAAATASILLDTAPPSAPTLTVTLPATLGAGNALSTTAITLGIASTDVAGALSTGRVRVDGDVNVSGAATTGWLAAGSGGLTLAGANFAWTGALSSGDGAKAATVVVRDAAGNESPASTVRFVLQSGAPASPVATLSPSPNTATSAVTLALSAVNASEVRIAGNLSSVNGAPANVNAWLPMASTANAALSAGDGAKSVTVTFRNAAGVETTPITLQTRLDLTAPAGSIVATGTALGAPSTTVTSTAAVTLAIDGSDAGSGVTEMRLGNSVSDLAAAAWRPYAPSIPWSLSATDGAKTVHLQLRDAAGNTSSAVTPPAASILLDTAAPTQPVVTITSPTPVGASNAITTTSVVIDITSTDGARAIGAAAVALEGDIAATGGSTGWLSAGSGGLSFGAGKFTWTGALTSGDGDKVVTVRIRDDAGNEGPSTLLRALLRTAAPANNSVSIAPATYATSTAATLTLVSEGATSMRIAGAVASVQGVPGNVNTWLPFAQVVPVVLTAGDGAKTVNVTFRNEANQETAAIPVTTTLDTAVPVATLSIRGVVAEGAESATLTGRAAVTLAIGGTDATSGLDQMRIATSTTELATQTWTAFATALPWTLSGADGSKTLYLQLRDKAGLISANATASIYLDTQPPSAPTLTIESPATLGTGNALATTSIALGISSTDAAGSLATGRVRFDGDISTAAGTATTGWLGAGSGGLALDGANFDWAGTLASGDGPKAVTVVMRDPAGNESPAATVRFLLQSQAPASPVAVLSAAPNTASTSLTVALGAVGASQVRLGGDLASVNGDPAAVNAWVTMASSANLVLTGTDAIKSVVVTFRNAAGVATAPITLQTRLDTTAPTGTLTVTGTASGAPSTTVTSTTAVTVVSSANDVSAIGSGLVDMRLANTIPALASATWRPYAPSLPWTLASGDGAQPVYMQLRDAAGNVSSVSAPISGSIQLDTLAPSAPVISVTTPAVLGTGNALTVRDIVIRLASTDAAGSLAAGRVRIDGDIDVSGASSTGWQLAGAGGFSFTTGQFNWSGRLSAGDGSKTLTAYVRDVAGNESLAGTIRFNLQTVAPTNPSATLSVGAYTPTEAVSLTLSAIGASQVRVAGNLASVGGSGANVNAWVPYVTTLAAALATGDGAKSVTVEFRNDAGLATTPIALATRLDKTGPGGSLVVVGPVDGGATSTSLTNTRSVQLVLVSSDAGAGVAQMRLADTSGGLASAVYTPVGTSASWTLPAGDGAKNVWVQFRDAVGNESVAISGSTTLDLTPPSPPDFAAQPAVSSSASVTITLAAPSVDALGGAVRYEWLRGVAGGGWEAVTFPKVQALTANASNTFTLRAVDQAGNVSAQDQLTIVHDNVVPPVPGIVTPASFVPSTTTSITLTGSESDANFANYETCTVARSASSNCSGTCTGYASSSPSFAQALPANQLLCVFARAVDRAGNASASSVVGIVADTQRPAAPVIGPAVDASLLYVRAQEIEVTFLGASYDTPISSSSVNWGGVAYLEMGVGGTYAPICPGKMVGNVWSPCNPAATGGACTDTRIRCRGTELSAVMMPLVSGAVTKVAARAVDLAGNVGDSTSIDILTPGRIPVSWQVGSEIKPQLFGTTLGYVWPEAPNGVQGIIAEVGPNRTLDPGDVACNVDNTGGPSYYTYEMAIGQPGVIFTWWGGSGIRLRRRGTDGRFCTADDPASTLINSDDGIEHLAQGGHTAAWMLNSPPADNYCFPVRMLDPGYDDLMATGDEWGVVTMNNLQMQRRFQGDAHPIQIGNDVMIVQRGGCPLAVGGDDANPTDWVLIHRYNSGSWRSFHYGSPIRWAYTAQYSALSPDGKFLATAEGYSITVRERGADNQFGTADDRVTTRTFSVPLAVTGLTTDGLRVLGTGSMDGVNYLVNWSPGGDAIFQAATTSDDTFSYLAPVSEQRSGISVWMGWAAFSERGNIQAIDLSTLRWEAADKATYATPQQTNAGLTYVKNPQYSGSQSGLWVEQGATERWVDFGANQSFSNGNAPSLHVSGNDALYTVYDQSIGRERIYGRRKANDAAPMFQAADTVKLYATPPANGYVYPMAVGDGKGLVFYSTAWPNFTPYVIEPGSQGLGNGTLVGHPTGTVSIGWLDNSGISREAAVWMNGGPVQVWHSVDGVFGNTGSGLLDLPIANLKIHPALTVDYNVSEIAFSGTRVAMRDRFWNYIRIVDMGPDKRFNTSDDKNTDIPVSRTGVCSYDCYMRMTGDFLAWIGTDAASGTEQVYLYDFRTAQTIQVSSHASTKTDLSVTPAARLYWIDNVFPYQSVMSFVP